MKLGLDLGNCTICAVGEQNGEYIYKYISSTYDNDVDVYTKGDVIDIDGSIIQMGKKNGSEFACINKYERLYLEHQILWAVSAVYKELDETDFILDLGVGLPINEYGSDDKRELFHKELILIRNIKGNVDGKNINININKIDIQAEGLASIDAIYDYIPQNDYPTLIYDIGFMTTDVVTVNFDNNNLHVQKPITINKGMNFIYNTIFKELNNIGTVQTKTELDYYVRMNFETIKIKDGEVYNLRNALMRRTNECRTILNDVNNTLGVRADNYNKIFIGGGSVLFLDILKDRKISGHVNIGNDLRYSANAIGYLINL